MSATDYIRQPVGRNHTPRDYNGYTKLDRNNGLGADINEFFVRIDDGQMMDLGWSTPSRSINLHVTNSILVERAKGLGIADLTDTRLGSFIKDTVDGAFAEETTHSVDTLTAAIADAINGGKLAGKRHLEDTFDGLARMLESLPNR